MFLNSKRVEFDDIIDIIKEKLDQGGTVTFTPRGSSMEPMLRSGEDVVVLSKPKGRLSFLDVALYQRDDGTYVMHRVIDFGSDGSYIFCGDNQFHNERGIRDDNIIGVMTSFFRKGKTYTVKSLSYRLYCNFLYYTRIPRHGYSAGKNRLTKLFGKKEKNNEKTSE